MNIDLYVNIFINVFKYNKVHRKLYFVSKYPDYINKLSIYLLRNFTDKIFHCYPNPNFSHSQ